MKVPEKIPLGRQTADLLEERILKLEWKGNLPGYRKLCDMLGVSPRTVQAALDLLERRKVIMPSVKGRPRQICDTLNSSISTPRDRKSLLVIAGTPLQMQDLATRTIVENIDKQFGKKGWDVDIVTHREFARGKPGRGMGQIYDEYRHHRWLLVAPPLAVVEWCQKHELRTICLGGHLPDVGPPGVGVSRSGMLAQGVMALHQAGHARICALAYLDIELARHITVATLRSAFAKVGLPFHENYNLVQLPDTSSESFWKVLDQLFKFSPPTALLATESYQVATIYSYCLEKNLRIPQDVSMIVTQESSHLNWFRPVPAFYRLPMRQYINRIARWVENYPTRFGKMDFLNANLQRGGSIADR